MRSLHGTYGGGCGDDVFRKMSTVSNSHRSDTPAAAVSHESSFDDRVKVFCADMHTIKGVYWGGVMVSPSETQCRGLVANCDFGAGRTVISVPLQRASLSASQLLAMHTHKGTTSGRSPPPPLDVVCRVMSSFSIHDPVLYEQVYLALLLAAERVDPNSVFRSYFDILPHPAIDDSAVIAQYKSVIDPNCLILWDDFQRQFLTILRTLRRRWVAHAPSSQHTPAAEVHSRDDDNHDNMRTNMHCHQDSHSSSQQDTTRPVDSSSTSPVPPLEVMYWALRTVLARMYMLPSEGRAPTEVGSTLPYTALCSVDQADGQTKWLRRVRRLVGSMFSSPLSSSASSSSYRLVPTLVPLLDMVGHVPSSNVCVDVVTRAGVGSCVELQALRDIRKGETIGIRFSTAHDPAFLLYRFGFIPQ